MSVEWKGYADDTSYDKTPCQDLLLTWTLASSTRRDSDAGGGWTLRNFGSYASGTGRNWKDEPSLSC